MRLSAREKYSYGIGAFGKDLVCAFVAIYIIPSIFMLACLFVYRKFYKLNGSFYENMIKTLDVRREFSKNVA